MSKFYGEIGYAQSVENVPGKVVEEIVKKNYYGDVVKNMSRMRDNGTVNDNLALDNQFRILADPYAFEHFTKMRYIVWLGVRWKITSVDVQTPRLVLSIGGVYNGR